MDEVNEQFLIERERIMAAATPGPWKPIYGVQDDVMLLFAAEGDLVAHLDGVTSLRGAVPVAKQNFSAIVDAVNHQPILIAEIRRLRAWQEVVMINFPAVAERVDKAPLGE